MTEHYDIVVVGSGAAGIAAAVTAARARCRTLLVDRRPAAGGTGGFSGLTTLCGLHAHDGRLLNHGFCREFAEALMREDGITEPLRMGRMFVQLYRPNSFRTVAARFLEREPLLATRWNTSLEEVASQEDRIKSLNGVRVGAVIDCSGAAEVGQAAGEELLATNESTQAPAVLFSLENVRRDLRSPVGAAEVMLAVAHAELPPLNLMPSADSNVVQVKFTGPASDVPRLIAFLTANVAGFEQCRLTEAEPTVARRAGRMIVGRYVLTGADVLAARKFPDAVARCSWPIEQWAELGRPRMRYLPAGEEYEIPARSLQAARTENLFMAGKSLSADEDAVGSARVMGCCLATGAAAGQMAASWVHSVLNE